MRWTFQWSELRCDSGADLRSLTRKPPSEADFTLDASSAVFTLVTRSRSLTSASKSNIEPNGGIFDVNPENYRASPDVKTPFGCALAHITELCVDSGAWRPSFVWGFSA